MQAPALMTRASSFRDGSSIYTLDTDVGVR
jgi:hypothetical protein